MLLQSKVCWRFTHNDFCEYTLDWSARERNFDGSFGMIPTSNVKEITAIP